MHVSVNLRICVLDTVEKHLEGEGHDLDTDPGHSDDHTDDGHDDDHKDGDDEKDDDHDDHDDDHSDEHDDDDDDDDKAIKSRVGGIVL